MVQEHERALGGWQAEWEALPDLARLTGGALAQITGIVSNIEVNTGRLAANLDLTHGLILGEAVMLALGDRIGQARCAYARGACIEASRGDRRDPLRRALERRACHATSLSCSTASAARPGELRRTGARFRRCGAAFASITFIQESSVMPFAASRIQLFYRIDATAGSDAPWLVLSNSLGADVSMWTPQVETLATKYRRAAL